MHTDMDRQINRWVCLSIWIDRNININFDVSMMVNVESVVFCIAEPYSFIGE
jgi:hypothetical protein